MAVVTAAAAAAGSFILLHAGVLFFDFLALLFLLFEFYLPPKSQLL